MAIFVSRAAYRLYKHLRDEMAKLIAPPLTNGRKEFRNCFNLVEEAKKYATSSSKVEAIIGELFSHKLIRLVGDICGQIGAKSESPAISALDRKCLYEIVPHAVKEVKKMKVVSNLEEKALQLLEELEKLSKDADGNLAFPGGKGLYVWAREIQAAGFSDTGVVSQCLRWLVDNGYVGTRGAANPSRRYFITGKVGSTATPIGDDHRSDTELITGLKGKIDTLNAEIDRLVEQRDRLQNWVDKIEVAIPAREEALEFFTSPEN